MQTYQLRGFLQIVKAGDLNNAGQYKRIIIQCSEREIAPIDLPPNTEVYEGLAQLLNKLGFALHSDLPAESGPIGAKEYWYTYKLADGRPFTFLIEHL